MCGKFNILILDLIDKVGIVVTNEKEGITSGMIGNHYLFTSFGKLVKRGGLVKACKRGFNFDWVCNII